jgi:hypothetical protein
VNEQLKVRLGEFLLSEGVEFNEVWGVEVDGGSTATMDILYTKDDGMRDVHELILVEGFLTFLVTGGK